MSSVLPYCGIRWLCNYYRDESSKREENPCMCAANAAQGQIMASATFTQQASLAQVNTQATSLQNNARVAQQRAATAGLCVQNTQHILKAAGTGTIEAPRTANHTVSAMQDLQKQGWVELAQTNAAQAPDGSVIVNIAPHAAPTESKGSDMGVKVTAADGTSYIGGAPGSAGAYKINPNAPQTSVYASANTQTRVFVPPSAVTGSQTVLASATTSPGSSSSSSAATLVSTAGTQASPDATTTRKTGKQIYTDGVKS
jgi:hypothetical protein